MYNSGFPNAHRLMTKSIRAGSLALLLLCVSVLSATAQSNATFSIGEVEAKKGEKVTGKLLIEKGSDQETFIPISIIQGMKPGPVLTLNAGVHGTEYVPVIVLQRLLEEIDPLEISGTLVLIHISDILAFHKKAVYYNPVDHKNLNRIFPGKKDGTISERIAYTISNEIFTKTDYYIDCHGGEFNEQIVDYIYFCSGHPDSELCKTSEKLALAMENKYLIPYDYHSYANNVQSGYTEQEAYNQGIGIITLEWGDRGKVLPEEVESALRGLKNVMKTIGMLEGKPFVKSAPVYLLNETPVTCGYDGIFYNKVDRGQYITKGALLGYTTDYWGNVLEKYYSPLTGIVVVIRTVPPISKGENICRVAEVTDKIKE